MAGPLLISFGGRFFLSEEASEGLIEVAERELVERLRARPPARIAAGDPWARRALESAGLLPRAAALAELRRARARLPSAPFSREREALLARAREDLAAAIASPSESLIALAREEERLERALARERSASDHWISPGEGPLEDYREEWSTLRESLLRHQERLAERLARAARSAAPNLSGLLGPKVAGRLVAAAGGVEPLARMSSSRLQLLGSRRRRGGDRGPKYGILSIAVAAAEIPFDRRGALARSLGSLAAIAARADASTHRDIVETLLARRDRRIAQLNGRAPG